MDEFIGMLPSQSKRLRNILAGEQSESKFLLIALLDDIRRGASNMREFGFLDGSEAEDETVALKLDLITLVAQAMTAYHEQSYELEDQIHDFYAFSDARHIAADLRVHDLSKSASMFVLWTISLDQEGRNHGEYPYYTLPFDVLVAIGLRSFEWYRSIMTELGTSERTRGIGTSDIQSFIKTTLKDSFNHLEADVLDVDFPVAMSLLRAKLGVKSPIEV